MSETLKVFAKIAKATLKAQKNLGKSVVANNPQTLELALCALEKGELLHLLGAKDTAALPRELIDKLRMAGFIWHTVDKAAANGRAIDVDLLNPLTGRIMTGSSSGSAVNVLLGINDIALATDGGGSVLAPALACNLFGVLLAGCGLKTGSGSRSTDGIAFSSSAGLIARDWRLICRAAEALGIMEKDGALPLCIAIPVRGNIVLPDGTDMRNRLQPIVEHLGQLGISVTELEFPDFSDRALAIDVMQRIMQEFDMVMTFEGPIDVYGMGDSVFGLSGPGARIQQNRSGKYLVKVANMLDMTAATLPFGDAATGLVIAAGSGKGNAASLFELMRALVPSYPRPELHDRYFGDAKAGNSLMFS